MCDFHSCLGLVLGENNYELRHDPSNSHSGMAGNIVNKPNSQTRIFEAECSKERLIATPDIDTIKSSIIRNYGECPEQLVRKIVSHYKKVREALVSGKYLNDYFADMSKWSDVWANVTTLPDNVKFPSKCGYLDLRSLTTLPDNVKFPETIDGYLYLSSLTTLPDNVKFPSTCGNLYLRSLTTLPDNVKFPSKCGNLYLSSDLKAQLSARAKAKK